MFFVEKVPLKADKNHNFLKVVLHKQISSVLQSNHSRIIVLHCTCSSITCSANSCTKFCSFQMSVVIWLIHPCKMIGSVRIVGPRFPLTLQPRYQQNPVGFDPLRRLDRHLTSCIRTTLFVGPFYGLSHLVIFVRTTAKSSTFCSHVEVCASTCSHLFNYL